MCIIPKIWSHHFMANKGGKMKTVTDFIFLGCKTLWMVTAAVKLRLLLLGRKAMTNLDSILKIRDLTLQAKVRIVKAVIFLVVIFSCESWTIKKADCRRIHAFELWYWRRLLRVPWTERTSNQSILRNSSNDEFSKCLSE